MRPQPNKELADAHESRQHFNQSIVQHDAAIEKQLRHCQDGGYRVTIKTPEVITTALRMYHSWNRPATPRRKLQRSIPSH